MEEYSENYGGFVTEIIESNIDADDTELKEIYTRIEEYRDTYYKNNVLVKQKIKELNPFYSQNKLLQNLIKIIRVYLVVNFRKAQINIALFLTSFQRLHY